jgi:hypothetical protein
MTEPDRKSLDSPLPVSGRSLDGASVESDPEDITLLKRFREDCKQRQLAHRKAFRTYKLLHHLCSTFGLGVSACSGVITVVLASTLVASPLAIISGVTSIAVGSLLAVEKACGFQEKMILHEQHSALYSEVVRDIQTEHSLRLIGMSQYSNVGEFIKQISERLARLEINAPSDPGCL